MSLALIGITVVIGTAIALGGPGEVLATRAANQRLVALTAPAPPGTSRDGEARVGPTGWKRHVDRVVVALGSRVLRLARREGDVDTARRWGSVVVVAVVAGVVEPLVVVLGAPTVVAARWWMQARRRAGQRRALVREVPEVIDLLRLAVDAGCTVHLALEVLGAHGTGPLARALAGASHSARRGARLADEIERVRHVGDPVEPLVDALLGAERHGAPISAALAVLASDARIERRRRAEESARRLPVLLLFPLVLCILPALGLLAVVPIAAAALDGLSL